MSHVNQYFNQALNVGDSKIWSAIKGEEVGKLKGEKTKKPSIWDTCQWIRMASSVTSLY